MLGNTNLFKNVHQIVGFAQQLRRCAVFIVLCRDLQGGTAVVVAYGSLGPGRQQLLGDVVRVVPSGAVEGHAAEAVPVVDELPGEG